MNPPLRKRIVIGLLVIIAGLVLAGVCYASIKAYRYSRIKRHFSEIHTGQAKQEVLRTIGSPDETKACSSDDRRCVETFWYYGFMEQWMVYFDQNDRVIDVDYYVSP